MTHMQNWQSTFKIYLQPLMLIMLVLGIASGLPYMMVFNKLSFRLREVGIDRSAIGFFYWVTFAYSFKFLWAPLVDRWPVPLLSLYLGHRRAWMSLAIIGIMAGMVICGLSDPATNLPGLVSGALILAFSGATLDICVDAWRIESAPSDQQAHMAATYTLGYRFAIMISGLALIIAGYISWSVAFMTIALLMGVNLIVILCFVNEPKRPHFPPPALNIKAGIQAYIVQPFTSLTRHMGFWSPLIFALVALYRISDFTMGVMAYPLYVDLGFSKYDVGLISSVYGVWITIFGALAGGIFTVRFGIMRSLLIGAFITMLTTALYAWLAVQPVPYRANLFFVIAADNIAGGFAATVFIAFLSSLVDKRYTATQYAFLSSLYAVFLKLISGFSGWIVDQIGYATYFLLTAVYCLPVIALICILMTFAPPSSYKQNAPNPPTL